MQHSTSLRSASWGYICSQIQPYVSVSDRVLCCSCGRWYLSGAFHILVGLHTFACRQTVVTSQHGQLGVGHSFAEQTQHLLSSDQQSAVYADLSEQCAGMQTCASQPEQIPADALSAPDTAGGAQPAYECYEQVASESPTCCKRCIDCAIWPTTVVTALQAFTVSPAPACPPSRRSRAWLMPFRARRTELRNIHTCTMSLVLSQTWLTLFFS